jgi:predicted Zn finger-like uncharacterized protein
MLTTNFSCPECGTVLKVAALRPAGKKVKCPRCEAVFAIPEHETLPAPPVHPEPERPHYPRRDEEDFGPGSFSARRARAYGDEPADDYGLDEPRPARKTGPRLRAKKGKGLLIGLLTGGAVLLLGMFAFAAWVWPGFLRGSAAIKGEGNEELLAFLPADANAFAAVDLTTFRTRPDRTAKFQKAVRDIFMFMPQVPKVFEETLKDTEKILAGGRLPADNNWQTFTGVVILKTKKPYSAQQIAQGLPDSPPQTLNGKVYHQLKQVAGQPLPQGVGPGANSLYLCLPHERVLVLAFMPPDRLGALLTAHGAAPKLPAETLALICQVDKSANWGVVLLSGLLGPLNQLGLGGMMGAPPEVVTVVQQLRQARAVSVNSDLMDNGAERVTLRVTCANPAGASQMTGALRSLWKGKTVQDVLKLVREVGNVQGMPSYKDVVDEVNSSITFTTEGATSRVWFEMSEKTIERWTKEMEGKQQRPGRVPNMWGW